MYDALHSSVFHGLRTDPSECTSSDSHADVSYMYYHRPEGLQGGGEYWDGDSLPIL